MSYRSPVVHETLPAGADRHVLRLSRGDLVASRLDGGGAPVVIVPGYFGSKEDFWSLFPGLAAAGYDVWSFDQLGQYDSGGPDDPEHYTVDQLAGDLDEVLAHIGDRPAHLVGHCLGGFVARTLTLAAPARVASLTLLACGPALHGRRHKMMLHGYSGYLKNGGPHDTVGRRIEKMILEGAGPWFAHTRDKMHRAKFGFLWGMAHSACDEPDRTAELKASGVPTFVLYGSIGGRLWSRRDLADMAGQLGAPSHMIPDSAHHPAMEQPAETTGALVRFFAGAGAA